MELIKKYFHLSKLQTEQLLQYSNLLLEWNEKVNLISRKDTESIIEKHILHSLALAKLNEIKPGYSVLDVGTGGGLPGIPLAILYPESKFVLVDSIRKKIDAVQDMVVRLGLKNVECKNIRAELLQQPFDIITGRAVTALIDFYRLTHKLMLKHGKYLLLKGGDLKTEIREFEVRYKLKVKQKPIAQFFEEEFFDTKFVLEIKKK